MQRWKRISIEQFALARRVSVQQAVANLKKLKADGLVSEVRTRRQGISGVGIALCGLTREGYEMLRDSHPEIGDRKPLSKVVYQSGKFAHHQDTKSALISARATLPNASVYIADDRADFERRESRTAPAPTSIRFGDETIIPDAFIDTEDDAGNKARYLIEVDRGSEPIVSLSSRNQGKTLVDMFARYWRLLEAHENPTSIRILFLGHSAARLDNIISTVPWGDMAPIDGWTPDRAFRLAMFPDAVGVARSNAKRVRGNFWGPVWRRPGHDDLTPLLRVPGQ